MMLCVFRTRAEEIMYYLPAPYGILRGRKYLPCKDPIHRNSMIENLYALLWMTASAGLFPNSQHQPLSRGESHLGYLSSPAEYPDD